MQRLSSNLTLFFKFFIPVFWLAFFGAALVPIFYYGDALMEGLGRVSVRLGAVAFYLSGALAFYVVLFPLKRVECDAEFVYASDYFKTFRYPWHNIARFQESSFFFFQVVTIELNTPGQFGKNIRFIASNRLYNVFWKANPEWSRLRE